MIAIGAADMALAGIKSVIPVDQVIRAMLKVGKSIHEDLRETGKGGIAVSRKGQEQNNALCKIWNDKTAEGALNNRR
jgi:L-serine dehydratase